MESRAIQVDIIISSTIFQLWCSTSTLKPYGLFRDRGTLRMGQTGMRAAQAVPVQSLTQILSHRRFRLTKSLLLQIVVIRHISHC